MADEVPATIGWWGARDDRLMRCPRCGKPAPDGARFCESGISLLQGQAPSEERKVVSVLLSDLVGSPLEPEQLQSEKMRATSDRALRAAFGGPAAGLRGPGCGAASKGRLRGRFEGPAASGCPMSMVSTSGAYRRLKRRRAVGSTAPPPAPTAPSHALTARPRASTRQHPVIEHVAWRRRPAGASPLKVAGGDATRLSRSLSPICQLRRHGLVQATQASGGRYLEDFAQVMNGMTKWVASGPWTGWSGRTPRSSSQG
ncbi:hypothetical protein BH18CHL1_BH18CHL1_00580 [soil metagenome]